MGGSQALTFRESPLLAVGQEVLRKPASIKCIKQVRPAPGRLRQYDIAIAWITTHIDFVGREAVFPGNNNVLASAIHKDSGL
jgi:hypothetical protein